MNHDPAKTLIYHITDVENLPGILAERGLHSDAAMATKNPAVVIGYDHIKQRRLKELKVNCCKGRFVGEFVPFYFCPRSPMLYVINRGNTGRSQSTVVHLVSTMEAGMALDRAWAISDRNAGAAYASFYSNVEALSRLDWNAIRATDWKGKTSQKCAEFLVADFFPWSSIQTIGCHNTTVVARVNDMLNSAQHKPVVTVEQSWYY